MNDYTLHGLPEDWDTLDEGHQAIYVMVPEAIPLHQRCRVIYELRRDVQRLNSEAMAYAEQLKALGVTPRS